MFDDTRNIVKPTHFGAIHAATEVLGFQMSSDLRTGVLLRTLAASKAGGKLLELGTGTGIGTSWLLDGMDAGKYLEVAYFFSYPLFPRSDFITDS